MSGNKVELPKEALAALMADMRADEISRGAQKPRHPAADELWAFLEGTGSWLLTRRINQHLTVCNICASRVKSFRESCRTWEGSSGEARLEKLRQRFRQPKQQPILFPVPDNRDLEPVADSSLDHITEAVTERIARDQAVRRLLDETGAIRSECDYVLPNGLHCGTHVDVGRICRSEHSLTRIVAALDGMLAWENFDTLVSTSWALAMIARRLALRRSDRHFRRIHHVMVEGYDPPCILEAVSPGARVVLLVDVVVTGTQIARITEELKRQNAASVKAVAIVDAEYAGRRVDGPFVALCHMPIDVVPSDQCPRCDILPRAEFNPVAGRMTKKNVQPRSPSEFLDQDLTARQFWEFVDIAGAFEHHRIVGRRHYIGFIDTACLLQHSVTGETIVRNLCSKILERSGVPDTVLVPARAKALSLGRRLVEGFKRYLGKGGVPLVAVRQQSGHYTTKGLPGLSGQRVLVVDAAAGHGDTLDELTLLLSPGAASVAGAVLLSRLSGACEEAFDQRLSAGFTRLYSMPVRPFTVRDETLVTCPFCLRRQDLEEAVGDLPAGPLKEVARKLAVAPRFRRRMEKASGGERQMPLLPLGPLATSRPAVASGIVLHALHAAMGDGMAPLRLPEIASQDISPARRAALVADLPAAALKWSGSPLENELCEFLKKGVDKKVWIAIVQLMSRSGSMAWVDSLSEAIINAEARGNWMDEHFWARMILSVDGLLRSTPGISEQLRRPLEDLVQSYDKEGPARPALKAMLDAAYQFSAPEPR